MLAGTALLLVDGGGSDPVERGSSAPAFSLPALEGGEVSLSSLEGQVVLINFWATWCKPCLKEIPALSAAYKKYKDQGFVLLGVMTDDVPTPKLQAFQKRRGMTYPIVRMDQELVEAFEYPESLPTTFVYSRDGRLHQRLRGEIRPAKLERMLKKLLADPVPPPKPSKKSAKAANK